MDDFDYPPSRCITRPQSTTSLRRLRLRGPFESRSVALGDCVGVAVGMLATFGHLGIGLQ